MANNKSRADIKLAHRREARRHLEEKKYLNKRVRATLPGGSNKAVVGRVVGVSIGENIDAVLLDILTPDGKVTVFKEHSMVL